ncbi:MAG: hypothetical protein Q4C50_03650 [Eubacteriales bacterium]|nr:hypothetical protein [Eubacteriales bacterium]
MNNSLIALEIMWKGMAGIFAAALIIMAIVYLLKKLGSRHPSEQEDS